MSKIIPKPIRQKGNNRTIIDNKTGRITAGRRKTARIAAIIAKMIFNGKVSRKIPAFTPRITDKK